MTYTTKITRKGQTTIPIELRRVLKLKEGQYVHFSYDKVKRVLKLEPTSQLKSLIGVLPAKNKKSPGRDQFLKDLADRSF